MDRRALGVGTWVTNAAALLSANARFWPGVLPAVRRELRRWELRADAIPDPALRAQALAKLRGERFNTEVAATLATLVPRALRASAIEAIVALQVTYDYLDGLSEQPVSDPLADGLQLHLAFRDAFAPAAPLAEHYRHHPAREDGGYLASLVSACRHGLGALPAAPVIAPVAAAVVARCGEAQARTHAVAQLGAGQLRAWAREQPEAATLRWHEVAAGAAASVLTAHALIALAADPATTPATAEALAAAYLATCALTTLLDSLVDAEADAASGEHAYLRYYRDDADAAARLRALARRAVAGACELPRAPHHLMTVGGALAFYLSAPAARGARARRIAAPMTAELAPLLRPALAIFALWRAARARPRISRARGDRAVTYGGMKSPLLGSMEPCTPPPAPAPTSPRRPARSAGPPPARPPARGRSAPSSSATASSSAPRACAR